MFDRDLFLSLCEKYNVELSDTVISPMIKEGGQIREITNDDVRRIFIQCQIYFDYSSNKTNARIDFPAFSVQEGYAIAC